MNNFIGFQSYMKWALSTKKYELLQLIKPEIDYWKIKSMI